MFFAWLYDPLVDQLTSHYAMSGRASSLVAAFAGCLPLALPLSGRDVADLLGVAYLGVFQIGLAYVLLTRSITHVPAVEASLLLLAEPALSPMWAWLLHGETPGPWPAAGGSRNFTDWSRTGSSASELWPR